MLNPYHYIETCSIYQPDGQHIISLLGWADGGDTVSDFQ